MVIEVKELVNTELYDCTLMKYISAGVNTDIHNKLIKICIL